MKKYEIREGYFRKGRENEQEALALLIKTCLLPLAKKSATEKPRATESRDNKKRTIL